MAGRREGERQPSPWPSGTAAVEADSGAFPSAIILFALVGATATTAAVSLLLCSPCPASPFPRSLTPAALRHPDA
jgi:hypothetical protein